MRIVTVGGGGPSSSSDLSLATLFSLFTLSPFGWAAAPFTAPTMDFDAELGDLLREARASRAALAARDAWAQMDFAAQEAAAEKLAGVSGAAAAAAAAAAGPVPMDAAAMEVSSSELTKA